MNKKALAFILVIIISIAFLGCGILGGLPGFYSLGKAKAIKPDPAAVFVAEFQTSYPDSHPGSGLIYESSADSQELVDYYVAELKNQGWNVTEVRHFDDFSQSVLLTSSKVWSKCYVTIENMKSSRKITIKVE